ncbi:MAG: SufD family Fe-S cluster assembly protein [Thermodesulfobacteriota bacterium]|nr:SufD family Fe-S cluster assembly protein [Thermodesulfobacteriota bacterium]
MTDDKGIITADPDLGMYRDQAAEHPEIEDLSRLSAEDQDVLLMTGMHTGGEDRSGTFFQKDHSVIHCKTDFDGAEVMSASAAREKYDGLPEYWWKALPVDKDVYTRRVEEKQKHGYFIRSFPGAVVHYPVQACLYLSEDNLSQDIHNIVIAEEGSILNIITGCATALGVRSGLHVGVSEFYVKKGATLSFTMIHNWAEDMAVRPRTAVIVEEGGTYISNYICLVPAKDLQTYPTVTLRGKGAVTTLNSVLLASPGSLMDVGSRVILKEEECRAEVISRAVSTGGKIIARGQLIGEKSGVRAHLECNGLLLSDQGVIRAIPELQGKATNLDMSHEAVVGKIAQEEVEYLMARGISEHEATSLIVKGFLSLDIVGLPDDLKKEMERIIDETDVEAM